MGETVAAVEHVELLVEEPSAEALLKELLPKILASTSFVIHVHRGKADLLANLPRRLSAYQRWIGPSWRIVVLVDKDGEECDALKARLENDCSTAGLVTRSRAAGSAWVAVTRLAIEELEAWYFGDWRAVRAAYPRLSATLNRRTRYRDCDSIRGGTWEALERELQACGYFLGGLRKIEVARAIGAHMDPSRNSSRSFRAFRDALAELAA